MAPRFLRTVFLDLPPTNLLKPDSKSSRRMGKSQSQFNILMQTLPPLPYCSSSKHHEPIHSPMYHHHFQTHVETNTRHPTSQRQIRQPTPSGIMAQIN